jgi:hypothetical protein
MAVPFLDLTRKLNECGAKVTYSDVLLVADVLRDPYTKVTPHHVRAAENIGDNQFVYEMILKTICDEMARRQAVLTVSA